MTSSRVDPPASSPSPSSVTPPPVARRWNLRWWVEIMVVLVFYVVYSGIRNQFGSATVSPRTALENAREVIRIEEAMGLFHEQAIQSAFVDWHWFMRGWNIYYGTLHFIVTIAAMVFLYRRFPARYARFRNTLAVTTAAALAGFSMYPLMPPRLLDDCTSQFGGCDPHGFVDSLARFGGLWSFDSGTMQSVSNQYAAMPSLHFGWSMWCCLALVPVLRSRTLKVLLIAYPWVTVFAIIVTANHFWLDAAGGAFVLAIGFVLGNQVTRLEERIRFGRMLRHAPVHEPIDDNGDVSESADGTPNTRHR